MSNTNLTHWKKLRNPDYLGSWDFTENEVRTLTIASAKQERVTGAEGKSDDCLVIYFKEPGVKPMVLNATNAKMIHRLAGSPYIEKWPGTRITIRIEKVKAFGDIHDALRIVKTAQRQSSKPSAPPQEPPKCVNCGGVIQGVGGKSAEAIARYTAQKYGCQLCGGCASKAAESAPVPPDEGIEFLD